MGIRSVCDGSADRVEQAVQERRLTQDELRAGGRGCHPLRPVDLGEGDLASRSAGPLELDLVRPDRVGVDLARRREHPPCPHDLPAALADLAQVDRIDAGGRLAQLFFELADSAGVGGCILVGFGSFVVVELALRYRPGSVVLFRPERSARMYEQDLDAEVVGVSAIAGDAVAEQPGTELRRRTQRLVGTVCEGVDVATLPEILWTPDPASRTTTRIGRFLSKVENNLGIELPDYERAWAWSVEDLAGFWSAVWEEFGIQASVAPTNVVSTRQMPGARWFEGAMLNYAGEALSKCPSAGPAIVSQSQTAGFRELTSLELRESVSRVRTGLSSLGVGPGDRVAAYMPNIPETVVLMLATASLGAIFSSCAPEFGVRAVVDRLGQIEPKVLVAVDGYVYGSKRVSRTEEFREITRQLPGLQATVVLGYAGGEPAISVPGAGPAPGPPESVRVLRWEELTAEAGSLEFEQVPFDHPLYILYSSGTTGLPKPIVHSHGGILIEHCKALGLLSDIGEGDRFFWFTTTGWMMWNYLVSGLLVGSCIVLFDGDPGYPDFLETWRLAERAGVTWFGTSAPFLMACRKAGIVPGDAVDSLG